jgi:mannan endo-1,4-beta-mannosidase
MCAFFCLSIMLDNAVAQPFVKAENGQFKIGKSNYYYIGANFWYGAITWCKKERQATVIKRA